MDGRIGHTLRPYKAFQPPIELQRATTGCGAETSARTSRRHDRFASTISALPAPLGIAHTSQSAGRAPVFAGENNVQTRAYEQRERELKIRFILPS
jgi:prephenate dehydrogenase